MTAIAYASRPHDLTRPGAGLPRPARSFLTRTLAAAVLATAAASHWAPQQSVSRLDLAVVLVAAAVAQLLAVHTPGNQVFHTGLAFTIAAALVLPPWAVVAVCVGQHLPDWARQRYPWYIQTFNIANATLGGLAAWGTREAGAAAGLDVTHAGTGGVVVAVAAGAAFVLVNHTLLARMLRLARGHGLRKTGLFTADGLLTDLVLAAVGCGIGLALLREPAAAPLAALPLLLIHRVLVVPSLKAQALRDHKTGLLNMRGLEAAAHTEFARALRFARPLSLLMIDIDDLRELNNRHGHLVGDAALVAVGEAVRAELRDYDYCARFGGDEFVVLLPESTPAEASAVAERLRERLGRSVLAFDDGVPVRVGASIGSATLAATDRSLDDLIERADAAMYGEKRQACEPAADGLGR